MLPSDPWSRPSMDELKAVLDGIEQTAPVHNRAAERLELSVPAQVITTRGNTIDAMTREISRYGIGLLHRGAITPGVVTVRMASDARDYEYRVRLEWCQPCPNGMFMSGGQFVRSEVDDDE
jgi:hypothetical protein